MRGDLKFLKEGRSIPLWDRKQSGRVEVHLAVSQSDKEKGEGDGFQNSDRAGDTKGARRIRHP